MGSGRPWLLFLLSCCVLRAASPSAGRIAECSCDVGAVDRLNNVRVYPRLSALLAKDYFRFFKVDLRKDCPFWHDDGKCATRDCRVRPCPEAEVPAGIKGAKPEARRKKDGDLDFPDKTISEKKDEDLDFLDNQDLGFPGKTISEKKDEDLDFPDKTSEKMKGNMEKPEAWPEVREKKDEDLEFIDKTMKKDEDLDFLDKTTSEKMKGDMEKPKACEKKDEDLDFLDKTISEKMKGDIELWTAHDSFCVMEDEDQGEYVDLLLNPERYTGYEGPSANRIWRAIYLENCFRPKTNYNLYVQSGKLDGMCLEERAYFRTISGLHSSINIHLCANYLLNDKLSLAGGQWGPNLEEFKRRFSPETTDGEGPNWIENLYFVYLLELRALAKAAPLLEQEEFFTGNKEEDFDTRMAVKDLLNVIEQFETHFDETSMFKGSDEQAARLKYQFKQHFINVTRIMDCVGCDKCKLWGKLQTRGLGTALKILFSGDSHGGRSSLQLRREEIVALFNAFGRLSNSIYKLDDFRELLKEELGRKSRGDEL